jgi:argininosuccinate lyase
MLTIMKGLPLAYNRDMQEDKEAFFDADATVQHSLRIMAGMLDELEFRPDRMREACSRGFLNATELADSLVGKKLPFREAHRAAGHAVAAAERRGGCLEDMPLDEFQKIEPRIGQDVYAALDYAAAVRRRETPGGTGPRSVERQLKQLARWMSDRR